MGLPVMSFQRRATASWVAMPPETQNTTSEKFTSLMSG
jgi:hypothetical protein